MNEEFDDIKTPLEASIVTDLTENGEWVLVTVSPSLFMSIDTYCFILLGCSEWTFMDTYRLAKCLTDYLLLNLAGGTLL